MAIWWVTVRIIWGFMPLVCAYQGKKSSMGLRGRKPKMQPDNVKNAQKKIRKYGENRKNMCNILTKWQKFYIIKAKSIHWIAYSKKRIFILAALFCQDVLTAYPERMKPSKGARDYSAPLPGLFFSMGKERRENLFPAGFRHRPHTGLAKG